MIGCRATVTGHYGDTFSCVLAAHEEDRAHEWPTEYRVYGRRLALHHDAEWLASELCALHGQIESLRRDYARDDTRVRHHRLMSRLLGLAPANAKRKTVLLADVRAAYEEARG